MIDYNYKVRTDKINLGSDLEMIEFYYFNSGSYFRDLGVSEADVTTYVTNCSGYIYAILISIFSIDCIISSCTLYCTKRKKDI